MKEIKILSIAGRSLWLAHTLCRQGLKVRFYDATDDLGPLSSEDQDGPFLLRKEEGVDPLFLSFFEDQKDLRFLDEGFCLSSPSGYLSSYAPNYQDSLKVFKDDFYEHAAKETTFWYDDFLKSFGKVRFKLSSKWKDEFTQFNPIGEFYIRNSEESDHDSKLSLIKKRGVTVEKVDSSRVKNLLLEIRKNYKDWVVDLTVTELRIFTGKPVVDLEQHLGWSRKRFKLQNEKDQKKILSLPQWSLWVSSFYKTWKQENCYILIKSIDQNFLDLWTIEQIYEPEKIQESIKLANDFLVNRFPYVSFSYVEISDFSSNLNTLFPISTGYSEINDTQYMWNSPREWMGFNSDMIFPYQSSFSQWLSKNFLNEVENDITI